MLGIQTRTRPTELRGPLSAGRGRSSSALCATQRFGPSPRSGCAESSYPGTAAGARTPPKISPNCNIPATLSHPRLAPPLQREAGGPQNLQGAAVKDPNSRLAVALQRHARHRRQPQTRSVSGAGCLRAIRAGLRTRLPTTPRGQVKGATQAPLRYASWNRSAAPTPSPRSDTNRNNDSAQMFGQSCPRRYWQCRGARVQS